MRSFPATLAYIQGQDLELIKLVWSFFLDEEQFGSVPSVHVVPDVGYVFSSAFGYCPHDSGVMVYFWTVGEKFAVFMTEDPKWDRDESEESNIQKYSGTLFDSLEDVKRYIESGE